MDSMVKGEVLESCVDMRGVLEATAGKANPIAMEDVVDKTEIGEMHIHKDMYSCRSDNQDKTTLAAEMRKRPFVFQLS